MFKYVWTFVTTRHWRVELVEKMLFFEIFTSSYRRCYVKKDVLKNFANFPGKHLCWSLTLIKLHNSNKRLQKKRLQHRCFFCKICEYSNYYQYLDQHVMSQTWSKNRKWKSSCFITKQIYWKKQQPKTIDIRHGCKEEVWCVTWLVWCLD